MDHFSVRDCQKVRISSLYHSAVGDPFLMMWRSQRTLMVMAAQTITPASHLTPFCTNRGCFGVRRYRYLQMQMRLLSECTVKLVASYCFIRVSSNIHDHSDRSVDNTSHSDVLLMKHIPQIYSTTFRPR